MLRAERLWVVGGDLTVGVLHSRPVRLVAYVDANQIHDHGRGVHAGVMGDLQAGPDLVATWRLEGRWGSAGYMPAYFDFCYDLHRWALDGQTKAQWLRTLEAQGWGVYTELGASWGRRVRLALVYEGQEHQPGAGRLTARTELPGRGRLRAAALVRWEGLRSPQDLARSDDLLGALEVRLQLTPLVYVALHGARQWVFDERPAAAAPFSATQVWGLSLGGSLELQ